MYIVEGIYPDGQRCKPLEFGVLDSAMRKLRDLVEADELDASTGGDGPMFVQYTLRIDPLPRGKHDAHLQTPAPPAAARNSPPRLRLTEE